VVPYDSANYRIAFVESFKRWGIYPIGIRTLSVESLSYPSELKQDFAPSKSWTNAPNRLECYLKLESIFKDYFNSIGEYSTREEIFNKNIETKKVIHEMIVEVSEQDKVILENLTGLMFSTNYNKSWTLQEKKKSNRELGKNERPDIGYFQRNFTENIVSEEEKDITIEQIRVKYRLRPANDSVDERKYISTEVHSIHRSQRVGPDGKIANHIILTLLQHAEVKYVRKGEKAKRNLNFKGGCTIIIGMAGSDDIKVIKKPINDIERLKSQILYNEMFSETESPFASTAKNKVKGRTDKEPFAALHSD
nr:hypothetical protein [Arcicella sp.]